MTPAAVFVGDVVHKRLRPVGHALRYRVFSVLIDPARTGDIASKTRLFSHNRFNLVSLHDCDYGNGRNLMDHLFGTIGAMPGCEDVTGFRMLCYPRILGYVFNPLTVYYALDDAGRTKAILYEVTNTFGQRKTYAVPVEPDNSETIVQNCPKTLYVSPFNDVSGTYHFRVTPPDGSDLTVGVALRTEDGPTLKAYFRGQRRPFCDRTLLLALGLTGFLTAKVTVGIHYEALKLWLKGLRLQPRPLNSGEPVDYALGVKERT